MARTTGSDGEKTEAAVREAAVSLIARLGYEAMSMRLLAAEVGVQAAALYRYFPTKEDLLFTLMREHMEGLLQAWEAARPAGADPVARLAAYVENHIAFHIERRHATHVSNMELRSLSHDRLTLILKQRSAYEKELRAILRDGAEDGVFAIDDIGLTAMALIQMMTGVIVWFRPGERLSIGEVTTSYLSMTMRLVGATIRQGRARDVVAL
ncbi:TetR/AcrR family transcriptional regulator [Mesorhizobium sp. M4A.F.Ca.ET.020.02.1.1]|uniref:TetR/AcrR family transcriptional regulator n=1 Tax=unclassified Mesorhizobium TaxID=325217 RepID=UPI000FCB4057|nr:MULTISPECIES: TetR/AcrR family transcriptional regulator [unclassified Mesorhizobium]RVD68346.1 TetR/AcrR family transcriptional regulator [Mesorhizobium sp. M4A.F.Ca.ET.029.04.2.1]RUX44823.1 TetR/AcrR family transcriptional regulator [Mesorhizobium sp. M4A.F.Ca.ET.050.02.1.1]RVC83002.1 TetR/AcrR family transcriptional regulator [Mesorhizobium sp. M4A.F.Ca.ET.022.05.2.1]RVD33480.1 TetR/AcrR family transcriptional regulator [Mesorhizobium sp. M4A.F.Ca.ET.020.02.1.1]RWC22378.1 MAG: TetR/AcrR 